MSDIAFVLDETEVAEVAETHDIAATFQTITPNHACLESLLFRHHRASLPQSPLAP